VVLRDVQVNGYVGYRLPTKSGVTMYCRWCATELPDGAEACPKCGKTTPLPSDADRTALDSIDRAVDDTTRAAKDLARAASQFTERLADKMKGAADDPKGTATRTARRIARDLDSAREEIEKAFREL
jgi:hypothetical protein